MSGQSVAKRVPMSIHLVVEIRTLLLVWNDDDRDASGGEKTHKFA